MRALAGRLWLPISEHGATVDIRRGDPDDPLGGVVRIEAPGERPVATSSSASLVAEVEADLATHAPAMQARWATVRDQA